MAKSEVLKGTAVQDSCALAHPTLPLLDQETFLVVDLEMTGLSLKKDVAIEIAALKIHKGKVVDTFSALLNPWTGENPYPRSLNPEIIALTGITEDKLRLAMPAETVWQAFALFAENLPLVGHNIKVDYGFLQKGLQTYLQTEYSVPTVDTLKWAQLLLRGKLTHFRLATLAAYFNIPIVREHRALDDARLTWKIYRHLAKLKKTSYKSEEAFQIALQENKKKRRIKAKKIKASASAVYQKQVWQGRCFVFTGFLRQTTSQQAMQYVVDLGGQVSDVVNRKTTDFVLGHQVGDHLSSKTKLAQKRNQATGQPRFWDESSFLAEVEKYYVHRSEPPQP